ncbi:MAG TPA: SRPBCC family protein [Dehalococcoidia bacterium]|nr:SRPBCC family protein [Dehalococcoidia bacterium]HIK88777.1 SRPBCC family protein [Dehalococcoidia bacterium]
MNIVGDATVVIDRPAAEVWEWVVDPSNMHLWVQNVDHPGSWIDDGELTAGSRCRIDYTSTVGRPTKSSSRLEKLCLARHLLSIRWRGLTKYWSNSGSKRRTGAFRLS